MRNRQTFDQQLSALYEGLFRIGTMVEAALTQSLEVIQHGDAEQAIRIIKGDAAINNAVHHLHEQALHLIATQQPMARDLRLISVVMSLLPELERIGDHAATICKLQRRMVAEPNYVPLPAMPDEVATTVLTMGRRTIEILHAGLEALRQRDGTFATRVVAMDDEIDHLYAQMFHTTINLARTKPDLTDEAVHLLTLAHNLERIGDRVTNLAEQIVFLMTGEIVELNH